MPDRRTGSGAGRPQEGEQPAATRETRRSNYAEQKSDGHLDL